MEDGVDVTRGNLSVKEMFFDINKRLKCGSVRIYIFLIKRVIHKA
jgi:hypothetical protein